MATASENLRLKDLGRTITNPDAPEGQPDLAISRDDVHGMDDADAHGIHKTRDGRVFQLLRDMEVLGADGIRIGRVKQVQPADVLVDRPRKRDLYVPFEAIKEARNNELVLAIPADQVDAMDWPKPNLI